MLPPRLVWFRGGDLRLHDNEALLRACTSDTASSPPATWSLDCTSEHAYQGPVVPVFCFDPRLFGKTHKYGLLKTGELRGQFLIECVEDLRQRLQSKGSDLVVRIGCPEQVLAELAGQLGASKVFGFKETCSEELAGEEALRQALAALPLGSSGGEGAGTGVALELCWGASLYHIDDLPFAVDKIPNVFKAFRQGLERKSRVRAPLSEPRALPPIPQELLTLIGGAGHIPSLDELPGGLTKQAQDPRSALVVVGGETAALARLEAYFWTNNKLKDYKWTRNQMLGPDYSSKFSAFLAHGCLSPRFIHAEVKRYEEQIRKNVSTYWLVFELIWRDHFRYQSLKHGRLFFSLYGPRQAPRGARTWGCDERLFAAWREGRTGYPLIDANMRELKLSGYMSNRGRQNVCSFLVHDLGLDWRMGAEWFESTLVDYDVCQNYGNWLMGAGVGADPRMDRYFSIPNQAQKYDDKGAYVALWLPELEPVPQKQRNFPHLLTAAEQAQCGVRIGPEGQYPLPIVPLKHGKFEPRAKVVGGFKRKTVAAKMGPKASGQKTLPFAKATRKVGDKTGKVKEQTESSEGGVSVQQPAERRAVPVRRSERCLASTRERSALESIAVPVAAAKVGESDQGTFSLSVSPEKGKGSRVRANGSVARTRSSPSVAPAARKRTRSSANAVVEASPGKRARQKTLTEAYGLAN